MDAGAMWGRIPILPEWQDRNPAPRRAGVFCWQMFFSALLQLAGWIEIITPSSNQPWNTGPVFCFCLGSAAMAEAVVLSTQERTGHGTRQARRLREKGEVPAVLYGHGEATLSLSLSADALNKAIRQGARVVDITHAGKKEKALI